MARERTTEAGTLDPARLRTGLLIAVFIGVSAGLALALFTGGPAVLDGMRRLPLVWLLVALALSVASWLGQGISFAALTSRGVRGNLLSMTKAFLGGDFPALVSPFGSGGIPGGVFCLTREGLSPGEASAVIAMHSLLTGAFFVVVGVAAAVAVPLHSATSSALVWSGLAGILVGVAVTVAIALRPRKAIEAMERALSSRFVTRVLGEERAGRLVNAASHEAELFATSVRALMRERPGSLALSFVGLFASRIALVAMALAVASPTPGGSGAVEAALTALLATQTLAATAAAAALLWRGITYYAELLVSWVVFSRYLAARPRRD